MPRRGATVVRPPAIPVRVCNHCHTCHRTDCSGQLSMTHRAWYCSPTCYQLKRVIFGEPVSRDQLRLLAALREEHYPTDRLEANKEHTEDMIRERQVRVVIDKAIRDELGVGGDEHE